jgi:hypothetical protein
VGSRRRYIDGVMDLYRRHFAYPQSLVIDSMTLEERLRLAMSLPSCVILPWSGVPEVELWGIPSDDVCGTLTSDNVLVFELERIN